MNIQFISTKVASLPDAVQQEVLDYVEFLFQKYQPRQKPDSFRFDWEAGLSESCGALTSVELQHQAMEWR